MPIYENPILYILTGGTKNPSEQYLNYNISAHTNPSYISAVENPIVYTLKSSAITTASICSLTLVVDPVGSFASAGEYFIISGDSVTDYPIYQFTSANEPKVNEFYSSGTTPTKSLYEYVDSMVYTMNENVSFRQRFYAVIGDAGLNTINIFSREEGSRYNLNLYDPFNIFQSSLAYDAYDGNIGQTKKDFTVFADVYINSNGYLGNVNYFNLFGIDRTYSQKVASVEIAYNPDNIYNIDVSNIVKNYIHTSLPSLNTGITLTTNNLINFYLVFGEKYDEFSNGYRRKFIGGQTQINWALNSSLDKLSTNDLSEYMYSRDLVPSASTNCEKYLTNSPNVLSTFSNQKQWLSFLFSNAIGDFSSLSGAYFQLRGRYIKFDGTSTNYTGFTYGGAFSTWPAYIGGCLNMNVSMESLGIPTSGIYRYTVELYAKVGNVIDPIDYSLAAPIKTYEVLQECKYEHAQEIHWLNPLGGWDTWVFNGETESKAKRKSEEFSVAPNSNPLPSDSLDRVISLEVERQITINSGWVDKEHADWLFELAKSKDVRLFEDEIHKAIIVIDVEVQPSTEDDLHSVSLTYRLAKEENTLDN